MSTLLLLRHGQANFAGQDYDRLSALGERQALATGAYLAAADLVFDRVLAGPRRRHAATAAIVLDAATFAAEVETDEALDEFADGNRILEAARKSYAERFGLNLPEDPGVQLFWYASAIRCWARGETSIEGCIGVAEFFIRVCEWLLRLRQQTHASQRILAVSSAGTIAMLICAALDLPPARSAELMLVQGNAALSEIAFSGERVGLRSFNGSAHLPTELQSML